MGQGMCLSAVVFIGIDHKQQRQPELVVTHLGDQDGEHHISSVCMAQHRS